uniref:Uncharacterized protein n=1 Tax=Fagus sylvatica TaxID=28930 RepID=A0A2N9HMN0_FAGSY
MVCFSLKTQKMVRNIKNKARAQRKKMGLLRLLRYRRCRRNTLSLEEGEELHHIEFTGVHSVNWPEFLHALRAYVLVPVPYRVHWCPFGELARIPTSFE